MKFGITPIGFVSSQLTPERRLPTGNVTFLLTDLEGSTGLLGQLGDQYGALLTDMRKLVRRAVRTASL